jgi:sterol desaturase/sphingolipid hydroxylase (fatty acid hydroxylase superfamily)
MDKAVNYIVLAIPVFFLLIGIELLLDRLRKTNYYRFNDAIANLSLGVGSQVSGVFLKLFVFIGYNYLYDNFRLTTLPGMSGDAPTLAVVLTFSALFIGVDFFYYWFHRLAHEISVLWGSHVVHHQSEEYNLTVALRQAWLQGAFSWVFYLPLALLGFEPIMFLTVGSFQTLYQFWIHTKAINKMPAWFEYVLNTPSHHRVHHGVNPKYIDRNHGGTLIIFDRMFGTFQAEEEEVVFGITGQPKSWNPLWLNFEYWGGLFKDVAKARNLVDAVKMLVLKPGWKPDYLGGVQPFKEVTPQSFRKYDTHIVVGLAYYIFFQFVLLLAGATGYLLVAENLEWLTKLAFALLIVVTLVTLGGLLENKRWAFFMEIFRLIVTVPVAILPLQSVVNPLAVSIVVPIIALISFAWLIPYHNVLKRAEEESAVANA